jgi:TolB-like protein/Tfp pilus assembly protein PilF
MWRLWPHLRRLWAAAGTVIAGLAVTWLYSVLSEQAQPHLHVTINLLDAYGPWLGAILFGLTTLSLLAARAHRRHEAQAAAAAQRRRPVRGRTIEAQPEPTSVHRFSTTQLALISGTALLILGAVIYQVTGRVRSGSDSAEQSVSEPNPIRSIAVLPLDNYSGDPNQEYFADGMTDELTTALATISALRVISRGSVMQYKGAHRLPTPEIAKALKVDAVVEGSVMRIGNKVRITAQLVDAPADKHLWAKSYERNSRDVLALQDEVALAIAREINVELTSGEQARFARTRAVDPRAYDEYLKGRYYLSNYTEERLRKAITQFEQAISADPGLAPAYSGLADAYGSYGSDFYFPATETMPKAKAAVEKALQLDNTLADAHVSLAGIKVWYDFDPVGGEQEFRRAIALNPNYVEAHHLYGYWLMQQGRFDESLAELKRAAELDPLSAGITADMSMPLMYQGKYDKAKEQCREALQLDPEFYIAQFSLAWADVEAGKFHEAIPELEKVQAMASDPFIVGVSSLGYAYAKSGDRAKAEAIMVELNQISSRRFVSPYCLALVYLGLGNKPRALDALEKAYEAHSQQLLFLKVDNIFDPLRADPRFVELLKNVGLNN